MEVVGCGQFWLGNAVGRAGGLGVRSREVVGGILPTPSGLLAGLGMISTGDVVNAVPNPVPKRG